MSLFEKRSGSLEAGTQAPGSQENAPNSGAGARRTLHAGGYATLVAAFAIAIAVVINLIVSALPATWTKPDLTAEGIYSLSQQTQEILAGLEQDVTIYQLTQSGYEDATLQQFLARYTALSSHVKLEVVDPVVNPNFAAQYTEDQLYNNDLIVVCGQRSRHISYYDIFVANYTSYYQVSTQFNGEQALTSAIRYVTSGDLPKIYALSGHGEQELPGTAAQALAAQNYELVQDFSLLTQDAVPQDAAAVLIYAPTSDISAEDVQKLNTYIDGGGKILLFTGVSDTTLTNLYSVTARFGLTGDSGLLLEGDRDHHAGYPHYLLPELGSHEITQPLIDGGYYVLMLNAHAIRVADSMPAGAAVTQLLTTSDAGYIKADGIHLTTLEQEQGDETGRFVVGAVATLETESGQQAQTDAAGQTGEDAESGTEEQASLIWFSSAVMLDDTVDAAVAGGNSDLFLNTVGWACGQEETISIHAKSLDYEMLTVPSSARVLLTAVMVVVLPLAMVICGLVIWHRRKVR